MNELVKRLSEGEHPIEINRPDKAASKLKERIELNYVHVLFKNTGTEIGIRLDKDNCDFDNANFEDSTGKVHLEGVLTLNYDMVKCVADIDLLNMQGTGYLISIDEAAYNQVVNRQ